MKFLLNDRFVTIGAIALLFFFCFQNYKNHQESLPPDYYEKQKLFTQKTDKGRSNQVAKHTIHIDPKKPYEDYSLTEKVVYNIFKEDITKAKESSPPSPTISHPIPAISAGSTAAASTTAILPNHQAHNISFYGNPVEFSYSIDNLQDAPVYNQKIIFGKTKIPKAFEQELRGMQIGETRIVEVPLKEIDKKSSSNEPVMVRIMLNNLQDIKG